MLARCASRVVGGGAGVLSSARGLSSAAGGAGASGTMSFMRRAFFGEVDGGQVFPYPCALDDETRGSLLAMVEPVSKFMATVDSVGIDETSTIPEATLAGARELGLFGIQIPTEFGGLGMTNTEYAKMAEEVVMDASLAVTLMAHQSIGLKGILMFGTPEQKRKYLPKLAAGEEVAAFALTEPGAGSDAAGISTRAVPTADGSKFILNGTKLWISNGGIADVYTVFAKTPSAVPGEKDGMTAFIVERRFGGVKPGKPEKKLGIKGSNTVELAFEDVPIPRENVLGEVGGGFKVAMQILNNGRFGMGAATGGAMRKLLGMILQHATTRTQFGRPLASFGLVQDMLANMSVSAYAAESMAYMTTGLIDGPGLDMSIEAAICKVYGSEAMWKAVNDCIQIAGGIGFMSGRHALPYERFMRDARILMIFEGTNQILRLFIALTAMRAVGDDLKAVQRAFANPLQWGTAAPTVARWAQQRFELGGTNFGSSPSIAQSTIPQLQQEAAFVDKAVGRLGDTVRQALMTHGKGIIDQQLLLARLADAAIDIYGSTACLSRITASVKNNGTAGPELDKELRVVKAFTRQAARRISANIAFCNNPESAKADKLIADIANDAVHANGYPYLHPIQVARRNH
jgi:very long chain acyl-CoA dehydrogenase